MIEEFLRSWHLFRYSYLAGWLIGGVLSLVGVLVVGRNQIFIGAAVSQASMLGIALGLWLSSLWAAAESESFVAVVGGVFAVLAALLVGRTGGGAERQDEAMTGWVFLFAASFSVLVLARSPHGLEEVHRLVSSSIIGAGRTDVFVLGAMFAVTVGLVAFGGRRLLLLLLDREMAAAVGLRVGLWETLLAVWLGTTIGFSIRIAGMTYAFGCLVLPALVARNLSRTARGMLWSAPPIFFAAGLSGFVLANSYDLPPAQLTVALLALAFAATRVVVWMRASNA
ncbi:MAG: hypothetical protein KatS3mg076_1969 [Candidatus Binatia bacterium]|nr:MAG: hypothetical protein KatS3mg076_1969 [Candidatus Binatia bacterium]